MATRSELTCVLVLEQEIQRRLRISSDPQYIAHFTAIDDCCNENYEINSDFRYNLSYKPNFREVFQRTQIEDDYYRGRGSTNFEQKKYKLP